MFPAAVLGVAAGFVVAHCAFAFRTYVSAGALPLVAIPGVFSALIVEFAIFGLVLVWAAHAPPWARLVAGGAAVLAVAANCIQLVATLFTSEFVTPALVRLSQIAVYSVTPVSLAIVAGGTISAVVGIAWGLRRFELPRASMGEHCLASTALLVAAAASVAVGAGAQARTARRQHGLAFGPPLYGLVAACIKASREDARPASPPGAEALAIAKKEAGLVLDPRAVFPLLRPSLYREALPFPDRPNHPDRPHVIVFFVESFSAAVLAPYNPAMREVTPNIASFAARAMRVDDYVNHTTPTVTGLRGQLCSTFPSLSWTPWAQAKEKLHVAPTLCLPHILVERGWHTAYLSHTDRNETYLGSQVLDWGFRETLFREAILMRLIPDEAPSLGNQPGDQQMFRATIRYLEAHDRTQPLFIAVSTIETHTGYNTAVKFGDGSNSVLNAFHNLDAGFGEFWRWFQASPWVQDTIVVVTGDHALYPQDQLRALAWPGSLDSRFDRMGLLVRDPTRKLPATFTARTSSIDFAPTMAQLLRIPPLRQNPWLGWSLLTDRADGTAGPGLIYGNELLTWRDGTPRTFAEGGATGRDAAILEVLRYTQVLEKSDRLWLR